MRGVPLVGLAVESALACQRVSRVMVSTDDEEIAEVGRRHGAEVPWLRPAELATDESPEWLSWRHAIDAVATEGRPLDLLLAVPATSPLRAVEDLDACVDAAFATEADVVIAVTPAHRNPWFNMVSLDEEGRARLVNEGRSFFRRQDTPHVYDVTTVAFAARPDFVRSANGIYEGRVHAVVVPPERALDVDTELDLRIAECLAAQAEGDGP